MKKRSTRCIFFLVLIMCFVLPMQSLSAAEETEFLAEVLEDHPRRDTIFLISPLVGYNRNKMETPSMPRGPQMTSAGGAPRPHTVTQSDTAPIYGLFAMIAHPRFVVNNYFFYTQPGDTDVLGNLFYLNLYGDPEATVTWNVGVGHLYHEIKPGNEDIVVKVPMVKAGPVIRIKPWGLTLSPYVGYAWERVDTLHGDIDNDSMLYGLTVDWRWRMINFNAKYYYQDSLEDYKGYHSVRTRLVVGFGKNCGGAARFDYMEHMRTDNTSFMVGPVFVF